MTVRGAARALGLLLGAALVARPAAAEPCVPVPPGGDLQAQVERAAPGSELCLEPGRHAGPLRVAKRLTLRGPRDAVIAARGAGTTVRLDADGAALLGVTVDGSGGRFDLLDAAVRVQADDVRVEGVRVQNALFGILVEQSDRVELRDNEVVGDPAQVLGLRGDGIRLWEVRDSTIAGNRLTDSRDLVVWYSPGNHFAGNVVERGRYGTHFMYSHGNVVEGGRFVANVVGIFVMYSRELRVRDCLIAASAGAAGVGLGAKESGDLVVTDNLFAGNTTGLYLDTSPLDLADRNLFRANVFRLGDTAVVFHSGVARNRFSDNSFQDNRTQVRVEGRGDALAADWRHNHFDDYAGYDLDGDGLGDLPYELRSLSEQLVSQHPQLALFRGAPALTLVELVGRVVPLFRARTLLVDPAPRMAPAPGAGLAR